MDAFIIFSADAHKSEYVAGECLSPQFMWQVMHDVRGQEFKFFIVHVRFSRL